MNTTPPTRDDDLPDEHELAALYARLPTAEPDPALDAAVLAHAARAVPARRRASWPVALGSAAILLLAVGVAWQVRLTPPVPASEPLPAPAPAPAAPVPVPAVDEASSNAVPAPAPAKPSPRTVRHADARRNDVAPGESRRVSTQAPRAFTPPVPPAPPAPPAPPSPSAPQAFESPSAETMSMAPAAMSQAAPVMKSTDGTTDERSRGTLSPAPLSALGPDDRIGEIRRLLGDGQREQALRELDDLRRRYPGYPLPDDLRDLKR